MAAAHVVPGAGRHGDRGSNNDFRPGFATALMHKDVGLALAGAESQGVDLPAASLVYAQLQKLVDEGLEGLDTTAIIRNIDPEAAGLPKDA